MQIIRDPVRNLLGDNDKLLRELKNDKLLEEYLNSNRENGHNSSDILSREQELSKELHELSRLRSIPGLVLEIETNLELQEFENCYQSLKTLRKKLYENEFILNKSFGLQQSVSRFVDGLHVKFVHQVHEVCKAFWKVQDDLIALHKRIKWGKDDVEIEYSAFIESVATLFFPEGHVDSKHWIIDDMLLADLQENVRATLKSIFNDHIHLNVIVEKMKSLIFVGKKEIAFSDDKDFLILKGVYIGNEETTAGTLSNFESILLFLDHTSPPGAKSVLVRRLCPVLANDLLKVIKKNASGVLGPQESSVKKKALGVNCLLEKLLNSQEDMSKAIASEIERLLTSEELYVHLQLEKIFQEQLQELRMLFEDENKNLVRVEPKLVTYQTGSSRNSMAADGMTNKNLKDDETEDWGWEADDGWDDQIDVSVEGDNVSRISKKSRNTEKTGDLGAVEDNADTEGVEDGWDDAWNVDFDVEDERKSMKSVETKSSFKVTSLSKKYMASIRVFSERWKEKCGGSFDEPYYRYKLNVLQTAYMGMCIPYFGDDWCQLSRDLSYIHSADRSFSRLYELALNYLDFNIRTREKFCDTYVSQQLEEFEQNESNPSWDTTITELLPFIHNEVIKPFSQLNNGVAQECITKFLKFLYQNCIAGKILTWNIISEKNSENLSEFISLIFAKTEVTILPHSKEMSELREKFSFIGTFLPLHLKDIMELFYHGDFYLFTTDEIIQWIVLLFAETPLRRNAIDDIREIRNVELE